MKCPDCTNHLKIRMKQTDTHFIKIWHCECGYVEQHVIPSLGREDELSTTTFSEWLDRTDWIEDEECSLSGLFTHDDWKIWREIQLRTKKKEQLKSRIEYRLKTNPFYRRITLKSRRYTRNRNLSGFRQFWHRIENDLVHPDKIPNRLLASVGLVRRGAYFG